MTKETRLKKEALASCLFRKHSMTEFSKLGKFSFNAVCKKCKMEVIVNTKPAPNDIDISGEAVALNCK